MEQPNEREKYVPFLKEAIAKGNLPRFLSKYMPLSEYFYKTLINSELWFSSPSSFNDPFDCQIEDQTDWNEETAIAFLKSTLEKISPSFVVEKAISEYKQDPQNFKPYFTRCLLNASTSGGVACFASTPNNPLLWAHYSEKHSGVCLVFDIQENYNFFGITLKINYVSEYPKYDFNKNAKQLPLIILSTKSKIWEYEGEIRTIQSKPGSYPFKKECLKEIIFGCKTNLTEIKTVIQLIKDAQYPNIRLRKVNLRKADFGIDIVDI